MPVSVQKTCFFYKNYITNDKKKWNMEVLRMFPVYLAKLSFCLSDRYLYYWRTKSTCIL
jgi:hypothetical protein